MKKFYCSALVLSMLGLTACNSDDKDSTATVPSITVPTLVSFAKLKVDTYAQGPKSGAFITEANGFKPLFDGQPVQGFSAALKNADGTYMAMPDNGFGTQDNSSDFLLRIYQIKADFKTAKGGTGGVEVLSHIQLRDPNKLISFTIVNQNTADRLLTGADFDPESLQRAEDGTYWIGEEFGPYLLHFDKDGVLLDAPIGLPDPFNKGKQLRSPQNQFNKANINYAEPLVQRSGGFEGMALSKDGRYLYPMLEKPLSNDSNKTLIISQFDLKTKQYTGKYYLFKLDDKAISIGDFQMFSNEEGVVIEHDGKQNQLEGHKKLIRIKFNQSGEFVQREVLLDMLKIANPDLLYTKVRDGDIGTGKEFAFPFQTVEDLVIENGTTLTLFNDNNFPFSTGRNAKLADDNEIIQIKLPKALY